MLAYSLEFFKEGLIDKLSDELEVVFEVVETQGYFGSLLQTQETIRDGFLDHVLLVFGQIDCCADSAEEGELGAVRDQLHPAFL